MTNPDNIVRVRARNGGRASVYEANGWAQSYSSGLLEGNGVLQNTSADMNVLVGGSTTKPDVVLAENPAGYKIALDLVGQQAVAITAPASNSRISAVVAYTDDLSLSSSETTVTGSPASCGLIVVNGTAAATPSAPSDSQIRNAITEDGATGSQASYAVIATIEVASGTTIITDSNITMNVAKIGSQNIDFATFNKYNYNFSVLNLNASYQSLSEVTIDVPGVYLLNIYNRLLQNKTGTFQFDWKIFIDDTEEYSDSFITSNGWGESMSASHVVQITSPGQAVSVKASVPTNSSTTAVANRRTLVASRIG